MSHTAQRGLRAGFSLIEIVIAVSIIGIIMAVLIPGYQRTQERAQRKTTQIALRNVKSAIQQYKNDIRAYPETLYDLLNKPDNEQSARKWEGPYLESESQLLDGFKNELQYDPTPGGEHPYELYSWGPNGEGSPEEEHISVWDLD